MTAQLIELSIDDITDAYFVTTGYYGTRFQDVFVLSRYLTEKGVRWFLYKEDEIAIRLDDWLKIYHNKFNNWMPANYILFVQEGAYYVTSEVSIFDDFFSDFKFVAPEEDFPRVCLTPSSVEYYWHFETTYRWHRLDLRPVSFSTYYNIVYLFSRMCPSHSIAKWWDESAGAAEYNKKFLRKISFRGAFISGL